MFESLRSRLLLSYFVVVSVALLVITAALWGFAAFSSVRYLPTLQNLLVMGDANRRELVNLVNSGANAQVIEEMLTETAVATGVRILAANADTRQVIYDSAPDDWLGDFINDVNRPSRLPLDAARDSIIGRFRHPNGSNWLVYARPTPEFNRVLIFYAQQEPTPREFFNEYFARPLLFAGILAFLLSILLAIVITRSVARPLQNMVIAAEAMSQGDYDQKLSPGGPAEVQRVAASFNEMAAQVERSQQAQRDFVANVSHDLKTPLTSVQGWSQALLDGTANTIEEQQQAAGVIYSETTRMTRMVAELLDLARIESGQLELARRPVDLSQLLQDVVNNLAPQIQDRRIQIEMNAPALPPVWGDPDRLTQIFTNLLQNGITHSPEKSSILLTAQPHGPQEVVVMVQDSGPGIPPADLVRIFERFYRVDRARVRADGGNSSGLGLAIVRELVEAHNGRIRVHNQEGEGAVFWVYLPVAQLPPEN